MLTIYIPLPDGRDYPDDEDAWFVESLSELIDEYLRPLDAAIGGFETGPDEVGLCAFGADAAQMADALMELLTRHCPQGTVLDLFYDEEEGEVGESETRALFADGAIATQDALPVADTEFAYRPFRIGAVGKSFEFAITDRYIFKAIATGCGLSKQQVVDAIDMAERVRLSKDELDGGIARLHQAGYLVNDGDSFTLATGIAAALPRTAKGNLSWYREASWDQVYQAMFA